MGDQEIQQQQHQHLDLDGPSPSTSPSQEREEEEEREAGLKINKNGLMKRSEMGLKVKFKLGNHKDDQEEKEKYVCKVCNKVFSSGKALGGHIRVHNLQVGGEEGDEEDFNDEDDNQNLNQLKNKIKSKPKCFIKIPSSTPIKQDNLDVLPTCSICDKKFKSLKSLFGHMRCHPEREWRGINPPPNAAKSSGGSSSSSSSSKELKLMGGSPSSGYFHVPKWIVKDKRGRKKPTRASPASDSASDQLDEEIPEAVYDLMLLASGRERESLESCLTIKQRSSEESKMKKRRWSEESENSTPLKKQPKMEEFDQESGLNGTDFSLAKKKKTKLWKDLENSPRVGEVMEVEYKCSDCNKSFPTHQALGGHRSSHNKFNAPPPPQMPPPNSEEEVAVNNNDLLESMSEDHIMDSTSGSKQQQQQQTHKCQICNKTFSTGQALGGHKRCHWNGHLLPPIEAQAPIAIPPPPPPPPATTATSSVASQDDDEAAASRNVFGFDLNELPTMEEGELEEEPTDLDYAQVQAQAHASFFYNSAI